MGAQKRTATGKTLGDFDEYAKDYRRVHNESLAITGADSDFFSEQKVRVVRGIEADKDGSLLDLGCGDGNSARFFRQHFPYWKYAGVDTSDLSIEIAKARAVDGAEFVHYDGDRIPHADKLFDVVFAACVFHHIDPSAHIDVLGEIRRVLQPGGRFYLFEHNPLNPLTRRAVSTCPFDEDAVLLRAGYTRKMLRTSGFQEIEIGYTVFFPNYRIFRGLHALEPFLKWLPAGGQYYARAVVSE